MLRARRGPARPALLLASLLLTPSACERESKVPEPAPPPAPVDEPVPDPIAEPAQTLAEPSRPPEPAAELPEIEGIAYLEVVTGDADPESELPMIVAFHGNTAYPGLMAWALLEDSGPSDAPAEPFSAPARFIFPRGVEPYGAPGHARWWGITARGALAEPEELAALDAAIREVGGRVDKAISALAEARPTRGKPIITGHSQGGILSFGLAVLYPDHFRAALPAAGWLPAPLLPKQAASGAAASMPILALHGEADTVVSYEASKASIEALVELGYPVEERAFPGVAHSFGPLLASLRSELAARL